MFLHYQPLFYSCQKCSFITEENVSKIVWPSNVEEEVSASDILSLLSLLIWTKDAGVMKAGIVEYKASIKIKFLIIIIKV